jgi:hypothetical protein
VSEKGFCDQHVDQQFENRRENDANIGQIVRSDLRAVCYDIPCCELRQFQRGDPYKSKAIVIQHAPGFATSAAFFRGSKHGNMDRQTLALRDIVGEYF